MSTQAAPTPAAPASGSTSTGNAGASAVAPQAAGPMVVTSAPGLKPTPGLEQLSPSDVLARFMGSKGGAAETGKPNDGNANESTAEEVTETTEETETESTSETEEETPETEETESTATESKTETEPKSDLEKGLLKELEKHPGLHKRIKGIFASHAQLKTELKTAQEALAAKPVEPATVLQAGVNHPLSHLNTVEAVEKAVTAMENEAMENLRWLYKHEEGGTWNEGGSNAQPMTKEDVASAIAYYEKVRNGGAKSQGEERKVWLGKYSESAKALGDKAKGITDPKGESREAKVLRAVPELMRDPEFLQILVDAEAGRARREAEANGITFVQVNPKKGTKPAGKAGTDSEPSPASKDRQEAPKPGEGKVVLTKESLADLRAKADKGDASAKAALLEAFVSR